MKCEAAIITSLTQSTKADKINVVENVVENRLVEILELLQKDKELSANQLAKVLNITERTAQRDLDKLKKQNKIKRIGSAKCGYW